MAAAPARAMAPATASRYVDIPKLRHAADHSGTANYEAAADALLALPNSLSPDLPPRQWRDETSPPPMNIERESSATEPSSDSTQAEKAQRHRPLVPLSRGALSSLDESITITPVMLAKHHLPKIMLGQGPVPIRDILYELTQTVPGFSRIPPAKARRIVVAALEKPYGGGVDCEVTFDKIGWGKWHAHIKGSPRDSAIGSFPKGSYSPERSERGYAIARPDSGVHMHAPGAAKRYRSGGSWDASSLPEEDESSMDHDVDMDMDVLEEAADRMSLDGSSSSSSTSNEDTDNEDWAAQGIEALRKASLPTPGASILASRGLSIKSIGGKSVWSRRRSSTHSNTDRQRFMHSSSVPYHAGKLSSTPEEQAALALMSLGSM